MAYWKTLSEEGCNNRNWQTIKSPRITDKQWLQDKLFQQAIELLTVLTKWGVWYPHTLYFSTSLANSGNNFLMYSLLRSAINMN